MQDLLFDTTSESMGQAQNTYVQEKDGLEQKLEAEMKHKENRWERVIGHLQGELEHLVYGCLNFSEFQTPNYQLSRQPSSQSSNNQSRDAAGTSTFETLMQLHNAIAVGPDALPRQIYLVRDQVNRHAPLLHLPFYDMVLGLLKRPYFESWMRDRRSSILLAEDDVTVNRRPVSPVSGFCADIAENLSNRNSGTTALLYCARWQVSTDPTSGPKGMMRTLIAQLLDCPSMKTNLNLEFMTSDKLEAYKRHELKPLCDLFITLVDQLPPGTDVFCIIDGISWYEQGWQAHLKVVTSMFLYLMKYRLPKYTATLKVLMTSDQENENLVGWATGRYRRVWRRVLLSSLPHLQSYYDEPPKKISLAGRLNTILGGSR
ncbi:hypothetical protein F5Y10DRAFT_269553 [Nemania abortiva]|nr:hypothetical protein F5Y10DRAFT_269553 [Nemania abortiva]